MNRKLLNLSGQIDRETVDLVAALHHVASEQNVPFFLVGAYARDLILTFAHGIKSHRATVDIDFGVQVSSWAEYEDLRRGLLALGEFQETRQMQCLRFRDTLPVDLVPFGEIAQPEDVIAWPPDQAVRMDVTGFEDAFACCHLVRIRDDPAIDIFVASLVGLAILKLSAWSDRETGRDRDAIDLFLILRNYLDAGNAERLWDQHPDLASEDDFDYERVGARLLGRDISAVASAATVSDLVRVLSGQIDAKSDFALALGMRKGRPAPAFDDVLLLLQALLQGLQDPH